LRPSDTSPLSPVSTAACLQIAACIPNFAIQEYPSGTPGIDKDSDLLGDKMVLGLSQQEAGFIPIPPAPGIGVMLAEDTEKRFPYKPKPVQMRAYVDGSFVDQ
jgi:galactonate dehydratase